MDFLAAYRDAFDDYCNDYKLDKEPQNVYAPIAYILELGGKRLRPMLTLMSCDAFGTPYKEALPAAFAVEMFHNFSLIHDDIMDNAPLRRGRQTVHEKWDVNIGILSGDLMLIKAYQLFENYEPITFQALAKLFSETAIKVCEGQQMDVDFETSDDTTIDNYLKMIAYKTAVLLGAALKMGAISANASDSDKQHIYDFGVNMGMAFQLQDDYLDAFGDPKTFGKQIGGDIIANKKTFLYLYALLHLPQDEARELTHLYEIHPKDPQGKIAAVKQFFEKSKATEALKDKMEFYTKKADESLQAVAISAEHKASFEKLSDLLLQRTI